MDGQGELAAARRAGLEFGPAPVAFSTPFDPDRRPSPELASNGLAQWLLDFGHDLTSGEDTWTCRSINQVTAEGGLQLAANFSFSFDPTFEHAVVHTVRVWRGGAWREAGVRDAFQLLQREANLERAQFDGSLTAVMVIPDIRVGDVVETCYSVIGSNRALGGHYSVTYALQWGAPGGCRRYRLRTAKDRRIRSKTTGLEPAFAEEVSEGAVERTWTLEPAPAFQFEPETPSWWVGHTEITVADELSWTEIADVFAPYYKLPIHLPPALEAEAVKIESNAADCAARVCQALHLVQSQVRYHSIAIGEGGYAPREIEAIWERRFGDCKDASRLLCALLKRLGIAAAPALVNTDGGRMLGERPPAIRAFNHCIVKVDLDGRTYWLDPTRAPQGGSLEMLVPALFDQALPLEAGATLTPMGEYPALVVLEVTENWEFGAFAVSPAEVQIKSVLRSWRADDLRRALDNDGRETLADRYRAFFEQHYGDLQVVEPAEFNDDFDLNEITVTERYIVLRPWVGMEGHPEMGVFTTIDDIVGPHLLIHEVHKRTAPIDLGTPRKARSERTLNFGFNVAPSDWNDDWRGPGVAYRHRCETLGPTTHRVIAEIDFEASSVPAADAAALYEFSRKARMSNGYKQTANLHARGQKKSTVSEDLNFLRFLPLLGVLLFMISQCGRSMESSRTGGFDPTLAAPPSSTQ